MTLWSYGFSCEFFQQIVILRLDFSFCCKWVIYEVLYHKGLKNLDVS